MAFYTMKGITGVEVCEEKDLVADENMKQLGFEIFCGIGQGTGRDNITKYFTKEDLPYVYAEVYHASTDIYFRLIIDKEIYTKYELGKRCIVLKMGSGDG